MYLTLYIQNIINLICTQNLKNTNEVFFILLILYKPAKFSVYFMLAAHLHLDWPRFKCSMVSRVPGVSVPSTAVLGVQWDPSSPLPRARQGKGEQPW